MKEGCVQDLVVKGQKVAQDGVFGDAPPKRACYCGLLRRCRRGSAASNERQQRAQEDRCAASKDEGLQATSVQAQCNSKACDFAHRSAKAILGHQPVDNQGNVVDDDLLPPQVADLERVEQDDDEIEGVAGKVAGILEVKQVRVVGLLWRQPEEDRVEQGGDGLCKEEQNLHEPPPCDL